MIPPDTSIDVARVVVRSGIFVLDFFARGFFWGAEGCVHKFVKIRLSLRVISSNFGSPYATSSSYQDCKNPCWILRR